MPWNAKNKYRNEPVVVDGLRFDSKKEAQRWWQLNMLLNAGEISDLKRQQSFSIDVNGEHICYYIADFTYIEKNKRVVEDVKSPVTARNPVYLLKKKLMRALHGLEVREV